MTQHSTALAACMRNEGIFVLEWLAHHASLGFAQIMVVTNACSDGSSKPNSPPPPPWRLSISPCPGD
ncbi:MAG: glycosyltransferase family 2 protein [Prochlorothrix sp.]